MFKYAYKIISLFIIYSVCFSQEKAYTETGKAVMLSDDGTWEYITDTTYNDRNEIGFRKAMWSDSVEKVKVSETATLVPELNDPNILGFSGKVGGLEVLIGYYFVNDKLWKGAYIFSETHSNRNLYIDDYGTIKTILIEKYGEPTKDDVNWLNDLYADDTAQYGFAVSLGHLSLYSSWDLGDTKIQMTLQGDNYKINHHLEYVNEALRKLAIEEQKKISKTEF